MHETTSRVDRTYIAERNQRILEGLQHGRLSFEQIAQHFGLSRVAVKRIAFHARTAPDADITYLAAPYAKPYGSTKRSDR